MAMEPIASGASGSGPLKALVYTSRATMPFDPPVLEGLVADARKRNRQEDVTGVIVFDEGRFLQWLEGPADGVERIATSIQRDPRHRDIAILRKEDAGRRTFSNWDMRLALRGAAAGPSTKQALLPPDVFIDSVMQRPEAAAVLLPRLATEQWAEPAPVRSVRGSFVAADVLPRLCARIAQSPGQPWHSKRDGKPDRLVRTVLENPNARGLEKFSEGGLLHTVLLLERAAERLGDMAHAGEVSLADLACVLARLQGILHHADERQSRPRWARVRPGASVLICHASGDADIIGPLMKAALLRLSGWEVSLRLESDAPGLARDIAETAPDMVVLTSSRVRPDPALLLRFAGLISDLRSGPAGPDLPIIVGGRIFADARTDWRMLGADAACGSVARIPAIATAFARQGGTGRDDSRHRVPA